MRSFVGGRGKNWSTNATSDELPASSSATSRSVLASFWSHGTPKSAKRSPVALPGRGAPGKNHEPERTPSRVAVSPTR